ncbi:MAG: hypothetical protein M3416_10025 [Acidobacteriota bacterium]|nr:hypothetical protein [Acidobacteriota bacterium]
MSRFDDFVERLEAALSDDEGREAFLEYLQEMTREERAELLAEAERRDPEGAAESARGALDLPKAGGPRKAQIEKATKRAPVITKAPGAPPRPSSGRPREAEVHRPRPPAIDLLPRLA